MLHWIKTQNVFFYQHLGFCFFIVSNPRCRYLYNGRSGDGLCSLQHLPEHKLVEKQEDTSQNNILKYDCFIDANQLICVNKQMLFS